MTENLINNENLLGPHALAAYTFAFPEDQIALKPASPRDHSRLWLMKRDRPGVEAEHFFNLPQFFSAGDCLILNNVKVLPVQIEARRKGEGRSQIVLTGLGNGELLGSESGWIAPGEEGRLFEGLISRGRKIHPGTLLRVGENFEIEVLQRCADAEADGEGQWLMRVRLAASKEARNLFEECGSMPLPPYIQKRLGAGSLIEHRETYQTVFASTGGAIAAPTASLHFTPQVLQALEKKGVLIAFLTLHVSFGTFRPIRSADIRQHRMPVEYYEIPRQTAALIAQTRASGEKVFAAGTTVTRALESAALQYGFPQTKENIFDKTQLFIQPGFRFQIVDALITNFHQPQSSLLILASAFGGREALLKNYASAIAQGARLFSYGDATLMQ